MAELVGTREQLLFGKWSYDEVEVSFDDASVYNVAGLFTLFSIPALSGRETTRHRVLPLRTSGFTCQHICAG